MSGEASSVVKNASSPFKRVIQSVFPVTKNEFSKFIPIAVIFFAIVYVYDLLRIIKSTMVVAQSDVGAQVIPYIKVYGVIPCALLVAQVVLRLLKSYGREQVFQILLICYALFYLLFVKFVYPYQNVLNLTYFENWAFQYTPGGVHGLVLMLSRWPSSLFYIATELWSSIAIAMVFWGFVNEVSRFEEATRFYPLYLLSGNAASILAGYTAKGVANHHYRPGMMLGSNSAEQSLWLIVLATVVAIVVALFSFKLLLKWHPELCTRSVQRASPSSKSKHKLSLWESLKVLKTERHLVYIAILVISYNFVFNLSDYLMETQLKGIFHSNIQAMTSLKGDMAMATGYLSVFISLFVSGNLIRHCGWSFAAYATPLAVAVFGVGFYGILLFQQGAVTLASWLNMGLNPAHIAMWSGFIQIVCSRGFKYTLFDTSKEMAYIPLSQDQQRVGKAAIDGVGSRVGKSFGSFTIQILLVVCSAHAVVPVLSLIAICVTALWLFAISRLTLSMKAKDNA
ncbi:MAG: Npt1/Npt2 family nucleotide transporter [Zetaproteobacteria bacterium]|nr:Npt1/Npt2 family nucleotide transporter [Zetaproteobacteria bacterium]